MDCGSGSDKNLLILIILSLLVPPLTFQLATALGGLDVLEQILKGQVLLLSLAVALLALFKETRL